MSYIDTECAQIPVWENNISWLYLDSDNPPNATTGQGYLVPTLAASHALPWYGTSGSNSTPEAIEAEWTRVNRLGSGMVARHYYASDSPTLKQEDINSLTRNKVVAFDADLRRDFVGYDTFPDSVKVALLDMEYGLGDAKLRGSYPRFDAAIEARDWKTAAQECGRDTHLASFNERNSWTAGLFLQAAREAV